MSDETLEKRIAAAITNEHAAADDLATLLAEAEAAIEQAEQESRDANADAYDLVATLDATTTARERMEIATLQCARLRSAIQRLESKLSNALAQEFCERWKADYQKVEARVDMAAKRFSNYRQLAAQLIALFREAEEIDREVDRVNGSAPAGDHHRLRHVELVARNLEAFSHAQPSIVKAVQLPDWTESQRMAWPPQTKSIGLIVAEAMQQAASDDGYGNDWLGRLKARDEARLAEGQRVAQYYAEQQRQKEERERQTP